MAYFEFKNGQTPINDTNLNVMQDKIKQAMGNLMHPVGSIYMSVNSTNPSSLFGGTWVAWGSGKVPVGVDADDTDFKSVEKIGGNKQHQHLLPIAVDSNIGNWGSMQWNNNFNYGYQTISSPNYLELKGTPVGSQKNLYQQKSSNENNLQPYITCYMWKRIA